MDWPSIPQRSVMIVRPQEDRISGRQACPHGIQLAIATSAASNRKLKDLMEHGTDGVKWRHAPFRAQSLRGGTAFPDADASFLRSRPKALEEPSTATPPASPARISGRCLDVDSSRKEAVIAAAATWCPFKSLR